MKRVTIDQVRQMLERSQAQQALDAAAGIIDGGAAGTTLATALYLRGNAYRQLGDWRNAMNSYLAAIDLDPDGPAAEAYRQAQDILNYYHHDYYNP